MPQLYLASDKGYQFIRNLNYGFYMEISEDKEVAILMKLEPGLTNSIIEGCDISLVIRNPNLFCRSCTLYVYDNKNDPFYATAKELGDEDKFLKGFDHAVAAIADGRKEVVMVLYNEVNSPVFSSNIGIEANTEDFKKWLAKIYNEPAYRDFDGFQVANGNFMPETAVKGFEVRLRNEDHSKNETLIISSPDYDGNEITSPVSGEGTFRHSDFRKDGKHGRLQELALDTKLTTLFSRGKCFFSSPRYDNNLEMIDFIILDHNAAILIESKYVISKKKNKRNDNIIKAINQLNKAEQVILQRSFRMEDDFLNKRLKEIDVILKICIINDRLYLDDEYAKQLSLRFEKEKLPLFLSVTVFSDLLVGLNLKNPEFLSYNLFFNLFAVYDRYLEGDEPINYHHGFSVGGMNAFELTELGKKVKK
ncbi:hypothetical protein [Sphingobacterium kitahiroshimense]|uniref:Uncharacterized protein n=1 Tax=Sphingobacterium kitahiroshimense TaxID=470446 RepID=A0ABV0C0E9_9SPHI